MATKWHSNSGSIKGIWKEPLYNPNTLKSSTRRNQDQDQRAGKVHKDTIGEQGTCRDCDSLSFCHGHDKRAPELISDWSQLSGVKLNLNRCWKLVCIHIMIITLLACAEVKFRCTLWFIGGRGHYGVVDYTAYYCLINRIVYGLELNQN